MRQSLPASGTNPMIVASLGSLQKVFFSIAKLIKKVDEVRRLELLLKI